MIPFDPIYDPPEFWRQETRRALAEGRSIESTDPILCLTGAPEVFLNGISTNEKTVRVTGRPPFEAHYWETRMWRGLTVDVRYAVHNSFEAKVIKLDEKFNIHKTTRCPSCNTAVSYEIPKYIGRVVPASSVDTFQKRFRRAWKGLELPMESGPLNLHVKPLDGRMFVCWRHLPPDIRITTDSRVDLDNLVKAVMDAMQSAGGKPGLLVNDKIVHLLSIGRVLSPIRKGPRQ